jgi:hypothetical protein
MPFALSIDEYGRLVLIDTQGNRHVGVEPVRAFPLSDPDRWVALVDPEGRELACVEDPATLSEDLRRRLDEELARREFVPVIERIASISSPTPPAEWEVLTDRGPTRFTFSSEDDVRRLGPRRALIVDSRGMRYEVPDVATLDPASRKVLDRYL